MSDSGAISQNRLSTSTFKQTPIGVADGAPNFSMRVFTVEPGPRVVTRHRFGLSARNPSKPTKIHSGPKR